MDVDNPKEVYAADLDGDGDPDVLSASWQDGKIAWYENTDGAGTFGAQQVIARGRAASDVHAADMDGDGDLDVLSASLGGVAWFENVDGQGTFAPRAISQQSGGVSEVHANDIDGDGDMDVIAASSGPGDIAWHENLDGAGTFGPRQVIRAGTSGVFGNPMYAADLDGDHDLDIVAAAGRVVWHENTDGVGTFGGPHILSGDGDEAVSVHAADVDGDGNVDVLAAFRDSISWYRNGDKAGVFTSSRDIETTKGAGFVFAIDIDGDDDLDALSSKGWYENIDGAGLFGGEQAVMISGDAARHAMDLDGDGDIDVLSVGDDTIAWYENVKGEGSFWRRHLITTRTETGFSSYPADVDSDGDLDLLSATSHGNTIAWYENTDGEGKFGPKRVIATWGNSTVRSVYAADIDGDGYDDVLSLVTWIIMFENTDGLGTFGFPQSIDVTTEPSSFQVADMDGDGDLDVLAATAGEIIWYENEDGDASFGPKRTVATKQDVLPFWLAYAADLDSDGDLDVVSVSWGSVAWYANIDGAGTYGPQIIIPMERDGRGLVFAVHPADMDGDGDLDLLAADDDNAIAWYENTDGAGSFKLKQRIVWGDHSGPYAAGNGGTYSLPPSVIYSADVDGDGDMDVLSATRGVTWHENTGKFDDYWPQHPINTGLVRERSVFVADMDNDEDLDIVYSGHSGIGWAENVSGGGAARQAGDANRDGQFNQLDIVQVLQADKYLTAEPATWDEGDWNDDGVFDQQDIVAALQTGNYLQGPYAAVDAVFAGP